MRPEFERLFEAVRAGDTLIILLFVLRGLRRFWPPRSKPKTRYRTGETSDTTQNANRDLVTTSPH